MIVWKKENMRKGQKKMNNNGNDFFIYIMIFILLMYMCSTYEHVNEIREDVKKIVKQSKKVKR